MMIENAEPVFADPTYDVTFKMLFGQDPNKDILISLLNSLLNFTGNKEIINVEINSNELPIAFFNEVKNKSGITSSVDILCTNKGKQKIAIEMQGQKTKYFLSREQEYMSKLISGQVKEGEGKQYHEKILDTYILVLAKTNIFKGSTALKNKGLYEIDIKPVVIQTNEIMPDNKMHWKFFELSKFMKHNDSNDLTRDSNIKYQWLEFLTDCGKHDQQEAPDRNDLIKKGYEIMKIANWSADDKTLYWKQKQSLTTIEEQKDLGFEEGKLKGEIKGDLSKIRYYLKNKQKFATDEQMSKLYESMKPTYKHITEDQQIQLSGALNLDNSDADSDIAEGFMGN